MEIKNDANNNHSEWIYGVVVSDWYNCLSVFGNDSGMHSIWLIRTSCFQPLFSENIHEIKAIFTLEQKWYVLLFVICEHDWPQLLQHVTEVTTSTSKLFYAVAILPWWLPCNSLERLWYFVVIHHSFIFHNRVMPLFAISDILQYRNLSYLS